MQSIIKSDIFMYINIGITFILLLTTIISSIKIKKMNKKYNSFMKKLVSGNNIEETLENYLQKVSKVDAENKEIEKYCSNLDKRMSLCFQKMGLVRYSAFKDMGSDLSFALALLDENNNGVVLNGIYSREMSNIYAKQINKGKAVNNLSEEEQVALNKAIENV